jgi:VanZ family protein
VWLALTVAWAVQISALSSSSFSSCRTESLLVSLVGALGLPIAPEVLDAVHLAARKLSHALLYAALTLLMYRTAAGSWVRWRAPIAAGCVAVAALYGLADEFHQFFTPDRGASVLDWGIDATGAVSAMALVYARRRLAMSYH